MRFNIFSIPIWIGNIDANNIKIKETEVKKTFGSEVKTSILSSNNMSIDKNSLSYLYNTIVRILDKENLPSYQLTLQNIWENYYEESDFQENHIHARSDLSFIIYKKVNESNTVFVSPSAKMLDIFYSCKSKNTFFGPPSFKPECRENQIIIFPSFLEHYVKKTSNAITIAGNLNLTFSQAQQ